MNFTTPPSVDDVQCIVEHAVENLPEELIEFTENMTVQIEEVPDDATRQEYNLDDPYDMIALFRSGKQIAPGVEKKIANDDDLMIVFRRPLLDLWGETGEDIGILARQVMIEELGQIFDFSDGEIDEMTRRHYQGML
jgi:predicted Zn-dependent protease with MMP-like domain